MAEQIYTIPVNDGFRNALAGEKYDCPFCLIFDREGKIVCGGVRGIELDVALKDLLGDKLKL